MVKQRSGSTGSGTTNLAATHLFPNLEISK